MMAETKPIAEIQIGPRAIWVNADTGECIGRFGVWGIDVHRRMADQHLGECLNCTHARTTSDDWIEFQRSMLVHHGVDLSRIETPSFVKITAPSPAERDAVLAEIDGVLNDG
jgi:hypothetical protein